MKTVLPYVTAFLLALLPTLHAERPICEITAFCYSMTAKDASEFTLTFNPAGQASYSMEQLDKWVEQKKAISIGSLATKGESGLHLQASRKEFSLDTETVVSSDASNVDIISKIVFPDQTVMSNVVSNNNAFTFAGNSTPKNDETDLRTTVYFVYLLSKITKK